MATDALRRAIDTFKEYMAAIADKTDQVASSRASEAPTITLTPTNQAKGS